MAHHRKCGKPGDGRHQRQIAEKAAAPRTERHVEPGGDITPVGQARHEAVQATATVAVPDILDELRRQRRARGGDQVAAGSEHRNTAIEGNRQAIEHDLDGSRIGVGGQHRCQEMIAAVRPAAILLVHAHPHEHEAGDRHDGASPAASRRPSGTGLFGASALIVR